MSDMINPKLSKSKIRRKWVKTLKESPGDIIRGCLGKQIDGNCKMCVLGMLGEIAGVCGWSHGILREKDGGSDVGLVFSHKELGLYDQYGYLSGMNLQGHNSLTRANDEGVPPREIGEFIEQYPHAIFRDVQEGETL